MSTSLEQARLNVQSAVDDAITLVESDDTASLRQIEESLWPLVMAFGQALVLLFLIKLHLTK